MLNHFFFLSEDSKIIYMETFWETEEVQWLLLITFSVLLFVAPFVSLQVFLLAVENEGKPELKS